MCLKRAWPGTPGRPLPTQNVIGPEIAIEFEVLGQGVGNRTIDWLIGPHEGRVVLMEVKRRTLDFISLMARLDGETVEHQPTHSPELLFRSVEGKFVSADPRVSLQGVWVVTDVKQDDKAVSAAFVALDAKKVHFAILGDWKSDAHVLVRRRDDEQYLRDLFHAEESNRFTFSSAAG